LTAAATVLTGIAFSSILFGTIAGLGRQINARSGALWGVAGFLCFNAAPALGLPPQPPGVALADLMQRQVWWVGTVVLTAVGLWLLAGKRSAGWPLRVAGMAVMILPHAIGAPEASGKSVVPTALVAQFTTVCLAGAALFWVALGGCGGFLAERYGTNPEA